jgi:hypothetical protein
MALHQDFKDLLEAFAAERVRYLLIGGYAVAFHSRPRFTKDIDLWIDPSADNVVSATSALQIFGAPSEVIEAWRTAGAEDIVYFGRPPVRIDLLRQVPGVEFSQAYARRDTAEWDGIPVSVIGFDDLVANKRAAGRPQDLLDIKLLERTRRP